MWFPLGYDVHKLIDAERSRDRERLFSHMRALKDAVPRDGLMSRTVGRLASLRLAISRRPAIAYDPHELTDYVCRLADGAMGRVAIRETDGEWIAVCVRAA